MSQALRTPRSEVHVPHIWGFMRSQKEDLTAHRHFLETFESTRSVWNDLGISLLTADGDGAPLQGRTDVVAVDTRACHKEPTVT